MPLGTLIKLSSPNAFVSPTVPSLSRSGLTSRHPIRLRVSDAEVRPFRKPHGLRKDGQKVFLYVVKYLGQSLPLTFCRGLLIGCLPNNHHWRHAPHRLYFTFCPRHRAPSHHRSSSLDRDSSAAMLSFISSPNDSIVGQTRSLKRESVSFYTIYPFYPFERAKIKKIWAPSGPSFQL